MLACGLVPQSLTNPQMLQRAIHHGERSAEITTAVFEMFGDFLGGIDTVRSEINHTLPMSVGSIVMAFAFMDAAAQLA